MMRIGFLLFTAAAMLTAACSSDKAHDADRGQRSEPATVPSTGPADVASTDAKDFIHHIAMVNAAEVDLGKLAAERGTAEEVRKFARMMIGDHTASDDKLKSLASALRIEPQGQLQDAHVDQQQKLTRLSGADFDREYAQAMVDGHKDLIDQLEPRIDKKTLDQWKVETNGNPGMAAASVAILPDKSENPTTMRVNQFAAGLYPTVHAHLEGARALKASLEKR
jgi:putative membrane protein